MKKIIAKMHEKVNCIGKVMLTVMLLLAGAGFSQQTAKAAKYGSRPRDERKNGFSKGEATKAIAYRLNFPNGGGQGVVTKERYHGVGIKWKLPYWKAKRFHSTKYAFRKSIKNFRVTYYTVWCDNTLMGKTKSKIYKFTRPGKYRFVIHWKGTPLKYELDFGWKKMSIIDILPRLKPWEYVNVLL